MSKINGDKARQNRRTKKNADMRAKMRELRNAVAQKSGSSSKQRSPKQA